jgi:ketosteroid isomerase-like protein
MTIKRLGQFGAAWARADLDALMGLTTDDCIYLASVGPEPGSSYRGREQVRRGFAAMLAYDRGQERHEGKVVVAGARGFAEWSFTKTTPDGDGRMIRGCDLFKSATARSAGRTRTARCSGRSRAPETATRGTTWPTCQLPQLARR